MHLAAIHIYPVKSCAAITLDAAEVETRGLKHDRRFLIVDATGRFVTGRELPKTVLVRATPFDGGIRLEAPGVEPLTVIAPEGNAERVSVIIWQNMVDAAACAIEADAWVSRVLGRELRLVYMDRYAERPVSLDYGQPGDRVSFADAYPMLLVSQGALDFLNAKLETPLPMLRFRPNLVIEGAKPHEEDSWQKIRIGSLELDLVKPCTRCIFTTVDPVLGERDPSGEPLETLKTYRRAPPGSRVQGITFGQNVIARSLGTLRVGDRVEILA